MNSHGQFALLTHEDYARLLACIENLHRCRRLEDFPQHALAALHRLVPSQLACYAEVDYARQRLVNIFDPPQPFEPPPEWLRFSADHPVLHYFTATGDGQALKISDFVTEPEYHQLEVYQKVFRDTGTEDQIGFGVRVDDHFVLGFAFARGARSFTEQNRMLLNLVRPHVIQAYLHLEELASHEELQRDLQSALRENGLGLIILNHSRSVVHSTPGAFEKLAGYLPVADGQHKLPEMLVQWAFSQGDDQNREPLVVSRERDRLIIRQVRQHARRLLLLSEESHAAERLARYGLTPREQEVLRWIAVGKSNAEIGAILGVTAGTVKIHVERILTKLGVENRTAAAALLHQFDI